MTDILKEFKPVFSPKSVAIIGASRNPSKLGYQSLKALLEAGYQGKIYPINPKAETVGEYKSYPSILEVPDQIDLAVISLPPLGVLDAVKECVKKRVKGIVIFASGFKELDEQGAQTEREMAKICSEAGIKIIGPNTIGMMNAYSNLNASFAPIGELPRGNISIVSQSGGMGTTLLTYVLEADLGFSKYVGVGNRANVEIADLLIYLKEDPTTSVICVFVEGLDNAREFMQASKEVAREKAVLVYKVGKTDVSNRAAFSHTGSLAGAYHLYKAAFAQAGILEVIEPSELVDAAKAISILPSAKGEKVALLTHTAGPGLVITEILERYGIEMSVLSEETKKQILDAIPITVTIQNPVDLTGVAYVFSELYGVVGKIILEDENVDALIAVYTPSFQPEIPLPVKELIEITKATNKPVIAALISPSDQPIEEKAELEKNGVAVYRNPERVAKAVANYIKYWKLKRGRQKNRIILNK
ncbi:MAG: acetate--CoA ligase family protein [Candidatus Lokiarchaeia archaeon]